MKRTPIILGIVTVLALIGTYWLGTQIAKTEYVQQTEVVQVDEFDVRVDELIASTTVEWQDKHRRWAEQEVAKQVIEEQETRLNELREEEVSF